MTLKEFDRHAYADLPRVMAKGMTKIFPALRESGVSWPMLN